MRINLTHWEALAAQPLPDRIKTDMHHYHNSCQLIALLALPISFCGILACFIIIFAMSANRYTHFHYLHGYTEAVSGILVIIGELLSLRLLPLLPTVIGYRANTIFDASPGPFDPMSSVEDRYCKALAFMRHFFNAFRCNLMLAACCHMGFFRLGERTSISQLTTFISLCNSFSAAIMSSIPVVILTGHWKMWNLTICDFGPQLHPLLLVWMNVHSVICCDSLIVLLVFICLSQRMDLLRRQCDATARYLSNISSRSSLASDLFTRLRSELEAANGRLHLLSYYRCFVASIKLAVGLIKMIVCFYNLQFLMEPVQHVSFCLWKATIDNHACLLDAALLMFAPVWWYYRSVHLRALVGWNCCRDYLNETDKVRRLMPPKDMIILEDEPTDAIEVISGEDMGKVVKYKEWLSRRSAEFKSLRPKKVPLFAIENIQNTYVI